MDPANDSRENPEETDTNCPAKPHLKSRTNSEENIVFDISKEVLRNG